MSAPILPSEKLFKAGVTHGFTTRALGDVLGSLEPWERQAGLPRGSVIWLNQIHGTDALVVKQPADICAREKDMRYDAAVTDRKDVVLTVRTADCVPLLLFCPE